MASAQTANSNDLFPIDGLWKSYHLTLGLDPALILTLRLNVSITYVEAFLLQIFVAFLLVHLV